MTVIPPNQQLNIIGCGQVGTALGYLLVHHCNLTLNCLLTTSLPSASKAHDFIGQGKPIADLSELTPANYYLIAVPDQKISDCSLALAATHIIKKGDMVFHCSGSISSEILTAVKTQGAITASLHPIKSFVDPHLSVNTFTGTYCGMEGDPQACEIISGWIKQLGGEILLLNPQQKQMYHAAFVIGCNYLAVLTELALRCLQHADINPATGTKALQSIMRSTLEQIFIKGTSGGLSGPIARGEYEVVAKQLAVITQHDPEIAALYKSLGKVAVELAQIKNPGNRENLIQVAEALNG